MPTVANKFEPVLERVGVKERTKIEKHLAACDAEAGGTHGQRWRRVAALLGELAPLSMQSAGNNTWRFFIADGKYRMQVFALEDAMDGLLRIFTPDILNAAVKAKLLSKTSVPQTYSVPGSESHVKVESLGVTEAAEAPLHYKHMLGWNRKALRITLSATEVDEKLDAGIQALAQLAAKGWTPASAG